jgi:2-polyprenyl-3-methyl-5-hydroxy-6-metoxy-1,4-benzoquinol methylase
MGTEQKSEYYDKAFSKDPRYSGFYKELAHFPVFQIALAYLKEMDRPYVMELGCGTGQFAQFIWERGIREYLGVDFSEKAIEIAKKLSPQLFKVADISTVEIPPEFDTFVLLEVLEHIEKDLEVLRRIPEGKKIIFSVPRFDDPAHVRHFTSKQEVEFRFQNVMRIEDLMKYQNWYIVNGVRNGSHNSSTR